MRIVEEEDIDIFIFLLKNCSVNAWYKVGTMPGTSDSKMWSCIRDHTNGEF